MTDNPAEIAALLAERDKAVSGCPLNSQNRMVVAANQAKCQRCGATASDNCGVTVSADWAFIEAVRDHILKGPNDGQ